MRATSIRFAGWIFCILVLTVSAETPTVPPDSSPDAETPVTRPDAPHRIITMAPNLTEIVFALGEGDRIVGVSDFDHWPADVVDLPRVGGYLNPDQETVIRLQPDRIFMLAGKSSTGRKFETIGIPVDSFDGESLSDIYSAVTRIGTILGVPSRAQHVITGIQSELAALDPDLRGTPSVLVCIGMTPGTLQNLYVAGARSFHNDILESINCRNVFGNVNAAYFPVSKESLVAAEPDIIVDIVSGQALSDSLIQSHRETWRLLPSLPAVKNNAVIIINQDFLLIPGPRVVDTAKVFAHEIAAVAGAIEK